MNNNLGRCTIEEADELQRRLREEHSRQNYKIIESLTKQVHEQKQKVASLQRTVSLLTWLLLAAIAWIVCQGVYVVLYGVGVVGR